MLSDTKFRLTLGLVLATQAAIAATPMEVWKTGIAEQNKDYAQTPHAMLEIQDAVYLSDGESASLQGRREQPASWRWTKKADASAASGRSPSNNAKAFTVTTSEMEKPKDPSLIRKGLSLGKNIDAAGQPTQVGAGIPGWRVFLFNQDHPAAKIFTGVSYFPYDPAFKVDAGFVADQAFTPSVFRTSRGTDKQFYHAGDATFALKGRKMTLPFYAESNKPAEITELSAFYTDGWTGKGTYGAGRYVDVPIEFGRFPPAKVIIDFKFHLQSQLRTLALFHLPGCGRQCS